MNRTPIPSGAVIVSGWRRDPSLHVRDHDDLSPRRWARGQPRATRGQRRPPGRACRFAWRTSPFAARPWRRPQLHPPAKLRCRSATRMLSLTSTTTARAVRAFHADMRASVSTIGPASAPTASRHDRDPDQHQQHIRRQPHPYGRRSRRPHESQAWKRHALRVVRAEQMDEERHAPPAASAQSAAGFCQPIIGRELPPRRRR